MKTAWITGTTGLIGSHLVRAARTCARDWSIVALNRQQLDLTDWDAVRDRFHRESPRLVIHCAALSNTVGCEKDPDSAHRMNVETTALLAELSADQRLVFFSTDLVFDGQNANSSEEDTPGPLGVYARTKLEAERTVLAHPNHLVIRTSINGGVSPSGRRGFNEVLEVAWAEARITPLFVDEFRSPIPAFVTARATWELALSPASGIYHVAGEERLSRFQIGQLVAARHPELESRIEPRSIRDYDGPPRAADCSLNCNKAQALLSFQLPGLTDWLESNPHEPF